MADSLNSLDSSLEGDHHASQVAIDRSTNVKQCTAVMQMKINLISGGKVSSFWAFLWDNLQQLHLVVDLIRLERTSPECLLYPTNTWDMALTSQSVAIYGKCIWQKRLKTTMSGVYPLTSHRASHNCIRLPGIQTRRNEIYAVMLHHERFHKIDWSGFKNG